MKSILDFFQCANLSLHLPGTWQTPVFCCSLGLQPRYQVGGVSSQMMGTPSAGPSIFVNIKFHHVEFHHSKLIYEQYPNYPVPYSAGPLPQMAFPVLKTEFHVAICSGPIFFLRPKYFLWMWDFCLSSSPC